jgi:hypothetical protein
MAAQMTDAYAACLIDTRGELRTNVGGTRRLYRPAVCVTTPDRRIAQALQEWDGGKIEEYNPRHSPSVTVYSWSARGQAAVKVLEATAPYLVGDKARHAEYILQRQQERTAAA